MRNFIIFFHEKTGTSPLVRVLDKFELITIVRQRNYTGFEPFDRHNCGRMPLDSLRKCFDIIFNQRPIDNELLNRIYMETAKRPLDPIIRAGVVGFKMRFSPPRPYPWHVERWPFWNRQSQRIFRDRFDRAFRKMMISALRQHGVTVLLAVRQDVLRLALSKYHGDGTGKPGHLQFKLARGQISRDDIGKINIDSERLETIIAACEDLHEENRRLMADLRHEGIQAYPVLYEDFLTDKRGYLERLFKLIELDVSSDEISRVLSEEEFFKKVHSDDISEFVENHEEIMSRFGDRFISWQ
jgi:hypothetical protein